VTVRRGSPGPPGRHTAAALAGGAALCAALSSCGDTVAAQPSWAASHPDTALVSFQTSAPGVCAITVRYPEDAPSAVDYLGTTYVQVSRQGHPTSAGGHDLGRSGDWDVRLQAAGDILLITPGDAFDYRPEAAC
jgi:hypothetical protein